MGERSVQKKINNKKTEKFTMKNSKIPILIQSQSFQLRSSWC